MQSRRSLTLTLAGLGLLLAVDSFPVRPRAEALPAVSAAPVRGAEGEAETTAAELLGRWNPHLTAAERARIARAVTRSARNYDLAPDLVMAVIFVESAARPGASSSKGALGLMQIMPYMKASLDLAGNPTTIESNIEAGCQILADNIARLGEDRGILAYFWGSKRGGDWYLQRVRAAQNEARRHLRAS